MNAKAKGRRNEWRSRRLLEAAGYRVTRAAASLGIWDLVGIGKEDVVLVQVKTRDWPSGRELRALGRFRCPPGVRKLVHRWVDGQGRPDMLEHRRGWVNVLDIRPTIDKVRAAKAAARGGALPPAPAPLVHSVGAPAHLRPGAKVMDPVTGQEMEVIAYGRATVDVEAPPA